MPQNDLKNTLKEHFQSRFGGSPEFFASPGRINLIGEHTDYNNGFVLPAAIDKELVFALELNNSGRYEFFSLDMEDSYSTDNTGPCDKPWANYLLGVIDGFKNAGVDIPGIKLVFGGTIPIGAGVSSSAAVECGLARALNEMLRLGWDGHTLAKLAQTAEHQYAGVNCGIMDQFAVLYGRKDHVIRLDCQSLEHEYYPLNMQGLRLVLCDSGVKHSLASSEYNTRRNECTAGVEALNAVTPAASLRDISLEQLQAHQSLLDPVVYRRCRFVLEENQRVLQACEALKQGKLEQLGELMYQSHEGLQHDYEVSCSELDELVKVARQTQGVLGARMMGGGFGGCTLNLIKEEALPSFKEAVIARYYQPNDIEPNIIVTKLNDGARRI